ncbi:MAG: hypothetical protein Q8941_20315 [Bacteroidota bacterium]|nr:hypothetical protein [Bacteroidota bacterium]
MKKNSGITSVEARTGFREKMIEKYVKKNLPPRAPKESKTYGMGGFAARFREMEFCAAELPVNGSVEIFFTGSDSYRKDPVKRVSHPVTSRFIVFCSREDNLDYKVSWTCSLS